MARQESDREDLFAEATAYPFRVELTTPGRAEPLLIGLRDDGGAGLYLTPDRVYHFTRDGLLRRAYRDGALYKADRGRLARLVRERTADETILRRTDLDESETTALLDEVRDELAMLLALLARGDARPRRATDDGPAAVARVAAWIENTLPRLAVARSPRA